MDRQGLVGAMPVGNRWRAQGYLNGSVKYLGTFDTEEEAHAVFLAARQAQESDQAKARADAFERVRTGPTYVYKGGVGRGAALNGRAFKIVEAKDAHSTVVVELRSDGVIDLNDQRVVLNAYLEAVPAVREAALTVESGAQKADADVQKTDLLRFVARNTHWEDGVPVDSDLEWAFEFIEKHAHDPVRTMLSHVRGVPDFSAQIDWLRANTRLSPELLAAFEKEHLDGLWGVEELERRVAAVESVLG